VGRGSAPGHPHGREKTLGVGGAKDVSGIAWDRAVRKTKLIPASGVSWSERGRFFPIRLWTATLVLHQTRLTGTRPEIQYQRQVRIQQVCTILLNYFCLFSFYYNRTQTSELTLTRILFCFTGYWVHAHNYSHVRIYGVTEFLNHSHTSNQSDETARGWCNSGYRRSHASSTRRGN